MCAPCSASPLCAASHDSCIIALVPHQILVYNLPETIRESGVRMRVCMGVCVCTGRPWSVRSSNTQTRRHSPPPQQHGPLVLHSKLGPSPTPYPLHTPTPDLEKLSFAVELGRAFYNTTGPAEQLPVRPAHMVWLIQRDFLQARACALACLRA